MNGVEFYSNKIEDRINNLIQENEIDMPYLRGFYYFIKDSLTESSAYKYLGHIIRFMNDIEKNIYDIEIDDYLYYLGNTNRRKSSSYQITVYSALKKFSEYLYITRKNSLNGMEHIKRPKFKESEQTIKKREIGYLDKNEIKTYIATVKNGTGSSYAKARQEKWKDRDLAIILIFLTTGIRCSALFKLDVSSIDFDRHILMVTDKGNKVIEYLLDSEVEKIIKEWLFQREKIITDNNQALFISNMKKRMSVEAISLIVKKYSINIDGKHITPHKLRATYGTQLYNETHDIRFVQSCMNHNSPKTTELYIRGNQDTDKQRAAQIVSKFLND